MKTLTLFFALVAFLSAYCPTVSGDISIEILQIGNDVVVTSAGSVDTTNLEFISVYGLYPGGLQPASSPVFNAGLVTGFPEFPTREVDLYFNPNFEPSIGPTSFGFDSFFSTADTGIGDVHGFLANQADPQIGVTSQIVVPQGYVSGDFLSSQMTFFDRRLNELGLTEGTYNWSFQDNEITLFVAVALGLPPMLGDVNQDGEVTFEDVAPFIEILIGGGFLEQADCNQDGEVNFSDIGPFINFLMAG